MTDSRSRPRTTPMAGRRKPTSSWCPRCETLHRTHRHALGEEACPLVHAEERGATPHAPALRLKRLGPSTTNPFNPQTYNPKGRWV